MSIFNFMGIGGLLGWFLIIFFGFIFFIAIRELLTWYWKINRITELLEKIEENTRK